MDLFPGEGAVEELPPALLHFIPRRGDHTDSLEPSGRLRCIRAYLSSSTKAAATPREPSPSQDLTRSPPPLGHSPSTLHAYFSGCLSFVTHLIDEAIAELTGIPALASLALS